MAPHIAGGAMISSARIGRSPLAMPLPPRPAVPWSSPSILAAPLPEACPSRRKNGWIPGPLRRNFGMSVSKVCPVSRYASRYLVPMLLVTAAYMAAMLVTFEVLMPLQLEFLPAFPNHASILFLPHGVRVLSAWLYRWRSVVLLMPGSFLGHAYLEGGRMHYTFDEFLAASAGLVCAVLVLELLARIGTDVYPAKGKRVHWLELVLAGALASIINGIGTGVFYGNDAMTISARFLGDVTGVTVSLFLLVLLIRLLERRRA